MAVLAKGGAKGEPGKTSSGIRGGEDKLIRRLAPFGGCVPEYNRHASTGFSKNLSKNSIVQPDGLDKCEQPKTPAVYR
jgi:hypothetical protein